ncbi:GNAT family protein [soil metagenome]
MNAFPQLETSRLVLRELSLADIPALTAIYQNREAMRWRGADCPASPEQVERMVNWFSNARQVSSETQWGIERKSTPGVIGICGLRNWDFHSHQCVLGYELDSDQRRNGYMAEALSAVLEWAFFATGFNRVTAYVHPENGSSLRVLRKQAFRFEGLMRQAGRWDDTYHDLMAFSLLRADFNAVMQARRANTCPLPSPEQQTTAA